MHLIKKLINTNYIKVKIKPWITPVLQKSISVKNFLPKKFMNCNDSQTKEQLHTIYKVYRILLSTLWQRSKTNYYNHYFDINWNNIKSTWKGILIWAYSLIINKINSSLYNFFLKLEEMTNNFQINTVYSDLLSKVHYQSES